MEKLRNNKTIMRAWWFFAYKGIYQFNWWLKKKTGTKTDKELRAYIIKKAKGV